MNGRKMTADSTKMTLSIRNTCIQIPIEAKDGKHIYVLKGTNVQLEEANIVKTNNFGENPVKYQNVWISTRFIDYNILEKNFCMWPSMQWWSSLLVNWNHTKDAVVQIQKQNQYINQLMQRKRHKENICL